MTQFFGGVFDGGRANLDGNWVIESPWGERRVVDIPDSPEEIIMVMPNGDWLVYTYFSQDDNYYLTEKIK